MPTRLAHRAVREQERARCMPWLENSGKAVKVLLRKISKDGQELECGKGEKEFQAKKKKKEYREERSMAHLISLGMRGKNNI